MPRYRIEVVETLAVAKTYIVDAPSPEEATTAAENGSTVEEFTGVYEGVIHREILTDPEEINED